MVVVILAKDLKYSVLLDFYGEMLTKKQQSIAELYYNQDLSLGEISNHENITRQGVHDNIKRSEEHMNQLEAKLKLCAIHKEKANTYNEIKELCSEMREMITPYKYLAEVLKALNLIEQKIDELMN